MNKAVRFFMTSLLASFFWTVSAARAESEAVKDDCVCEEAKCGPCENQVNLKFYTEKCGPGKTQVKSCKRPVCELMKPLPEMCRAQYGQQQHQRTVAHVPAPKEMLKKIKASVGTIVVAKGAAWVTPESGKPKAAKVGLKIFEKDVIETGKDGQVRVLFNDKNIMNIVPGSKARITEVQMDTADQDHTMIDLIYGKIRSKVQKNYDGANNNNYYRVRTKSAVAGVRGTDFVVSYFEGHGIETKVQTLEGKVALAARQGMDDHGKHLDEKESKQTIEIPKGNYAKFVIDKDAIGTDVFSEADISNFVARGYLTPVYQLTEKELKLLDADTGLHEPERQVANSGKAKDHLCREPSAAFNQCVWTCKGNGHSGAKCDTSLPGVSCVRKRCNANGRWAEETRMPASLSTFCRGDRDVVKPCDY